MVPWTNKDGSVKGFVECWDSPGGDGCWSFGSWGEMPVDAGLLAIVPRELCEEEDDPAKMGIVHQDKPSLETHNHGFRNCAPVILNDRNCDGYEECDECDDICATDQMWYCDTCGKQTCCGCGCEECEGCGRMFEVSYRETYCDKCTECDECDKVVEISEYDWEEATCYTCLEAREEE